MRLPVVVTGALLALGSTPAASAALSASCGPLEYGGSGAPDVLIASDFPLSEDHRGGDVAQNAQAVRLVLEQSGWKAGMANVGLHSCDNATRATGRWMPGRCSANARGYAETPAVVAVVGPFNSGCAAIQIPVLNAAPGGGVPLVSPSNTFTCLTRKAPGCVPSEPARYYPTGVRTYARVIGNDAFQAAGLASFVRQRSLRRVYVLHDRTAYGRAIALMFRAAVRGSGVRVVGFGSWNARARSYRALMQSVARTRPAAVLLAGLIDTNGDRVIRDKVAVLGPNTGRVKLIASDGFLWHATIRAAGRRAARGLLAAVTGAPPDRLPARGAAFTEAFRERFGVGSVDPYVAESAQASEMILAAIAASARSRAGVRAALFSTPVTDGLLGSFALDARGDPTASHVTVWAVGSGNWNVARVLRVPAAAANRAAG